MATVTTVPRSAGVDRNTLARRGLTAAAFALAGVAAVRLVAVLLAPDLAALDPFGWTPIVLVTLLAAAGGTLVYALLAARETATRDFLALAALVLALSFVPLVTGAAAMPGMTTLGLVVLGVFHVVAAVGIAVPLVGRAAF
ncbi:hypothetical protein [Halosegnis marinus]|uniref:Uncharacterized protein n=1 Tax=Halosegnis marinus TaxID=3034023 RepID=A0ABD5ZME3_9EURY|nr:hypothetical protein [Halosegnis sp. DT85]